MRKTPTLQDVARVLGMTKSTVSEALSGKGNVSAKTRARIISVAQELGYAPNPLAQRLASGYQNDFVCLFSGVLDTGLSTEKVLLIQQALVEWSLEVPIYACAKITRDLAQAQVQQIKQLCRQRPRAIICASQMVDPLVFEELDLYQRGGGLVVSYDTPAPLDCDQVIFDREGNAYQAMRYLLAKGHRRIGVGMSEAGWRSPGTENNPYIHRMRGYQRAFQEFGVSLRDEWLFLNASYERGGAEMAQKFLAMKDRPTAVCIVNDYMAMAFMVEVMRAGVRVPEELSLIGHDNQPIASFCPVPLTCATQPAERIVATVVELMMERIQGAAKDAPSRCVTITSELVERASVSEV